MARNTKKLKDIGFGVDGTSEFLRLINPDGNANVRRINSKKGFYYTYNYLINVSWGIFVVYAFIGFILVNILFTSIYFYSGGVTDVTPETPLSFMEYFYFSVQTLTTVGYGAMSPTNHITSIVSSIEAFIGISSTALITGLIYARFSRPKPALQFSGNFLIREFKGKQAIMFRVVNQKSNTLTKLNVTLATSLRENDSRNYYPLKLERENLPYLPLTWTLVHEIDEESPFFKYSPSEIINKHGELLITISYFDNTYSEEIHRNYSYLLNQGILNQKFVRAFDYKDGERILDLEKLNETEAL